MGIVACKIDGCVKAVSIKKWQLCRSHYQAEWAAGALETRSYRSLAPIRLWACEICSNQFKSRQQRRFCSKSCSNKWARNVGDRPCVAEGCVRPFVAKGLCHAHYKQKARAEGREKNAPWDDRRRANWEKREALKRGAGVSERVVAAEVFERDGWMCGICDGRIDSAISYPDPLSASLDHVLPLSRGGTHTLENVQAAHLGCNLSKGNKV